MEGVEVPEFMDDDYYMLFVTESTTIKAKSKTTYINCLKRAVRVCGEPLHTIVFDPNKYAKVIESKISSKDSIKCLYTSLLVIIKSSDIRHYYPKVYTYWYSHFLRVKRELTRRFIKQEPTEKHIQSFEPWEKILKSIETYEYGSKEHLLLSLTTLIPPRRQLDWFKVRIYSKATDKPRHDHNLIHLGTEKPFVTLSDYKTVKFFKRWFKFLPEDLLKVLRASLESNPREWLFVKRDGQPYTLDTSFTKWSNSVFKKAFGNKHASMNTLRHSYADYIRRNSSNMDLQERVRIARDMGHNLFTTMGYAHKHNVTKAVAVKNVRVNALRL